MPAIIQYPQPEARLSRKITVNLDQYQYNVRPVIKGKYSKLI